MNFHYLKLKKNHEFTNHYLRIIQKTVYCEKIKNGVSISHFKNKTLYLRRF